MERDEGE
jgi:hypothetical protein